MGYYNTNITYACIYELVNIYLNQGVDAILVNSLNSSLPCLNTEGQQNKMIYFPDRLTG